MANLRQTNLGVVERFLKASGEIHPRMTTSIQSSTGKIYFEDRVLYADNSPIAYFKKDRMNPVYIRNHQKYYSTYSNKWIDTVVELANQYGLQVVRFNGFDLDEEE